MYVECDKCGYIMDVPLGYGNQPCPKCGKGTMKEMIG